MYRPESGSFTFCIVMLDKKYHMLDIYIVKLQSYSQ